MLRIRTMRPPVVGGRIVFADFYNRQLLRIKARERKNGREKKRRPQNRAERFRMKYLEISIFFILPIDEKRCFLL